MVDVLLTLTAIQHQKNIKPTARAKAKGFCESLLECETILTAQLFLRIFEETSPLSKYLQTSGMDILSAHRMVVRTQESLKDMARDFESVKNAAVVCLINKKRQEVEDDIEFEMETTLPHKRVGKRKMMPCEEAEDEPLTDVERAYKVNVHNVIEDTVNESINQRFLSHGTVYADFALLDPKNFAQICSGSLSGTALQELSKCLLTFDDRASLFILQCEIKNLAVHWTKLKTSVLDNWWD